MSDTQTSYRWLIAPLLGNSHGFIFEKSQRGTPLEGAAYELLNRYNDIMPKVGSINVMHDLQKNVVVGSLSYRKEGERWAFTVTSVSDDLPL